MHGFYEGGSERQAVQLIRRLSERGTYQVHLASLYEGGPLRTEVDRLNVGEVRIYPLESFHDLNALTQLRRFASYLRQGDIDIVHTHDFYSNVFGITAAALARVPVRLASRRETVGTRSPMQKRTERVIYRLADVIIANGQAVRDHLVEEGVRPQKIEIVYNGVDLARVAPSAKPRMELLRSLNLPVKEERQFITIVANLRLKVKDHATFLRAAQQVHAVESRSAFVLAGEGEFLTPLRALAVELGIDKDTFFLGRCDRVADLLAVSDVCVLSSQAEGFSNAILEYMAAARPVVATDVGGARELVSEGEAGYLVSAGDDKAMALRIISLLKDPKRALAMGAYGRTVVADRFSCDAQLARVEEIYERLLTAKVRCRQKAPVYDRSGVPTTRALESKVTPTTKL